MSHHSNNQSASGSGSGSDSYSRMSGLKHRKIISGVLEGKSPTDYESAWSPTSPLDFRLLSSFGNPFGGGGGGSSSSSRLIRKRQKKSWDSGKVGLSIVDSDTDDSKNIIFGSLMRSGNPKCPKPNHQHHQQHHQLPNPILPLLFPKTPIIDVVELGTSSYRNNNAFQVPGSVSESGEIEMSEDYTCVISYGSHPKTTHFYGDQVLEESFVERNAMQKDFGYGNKKKSIFEIAPLPLTTPTDDDLLPPKDFLSFCSFCNKKLALGKDIYMYRGYKAFCSNECRSEVIFLDEEMVDDEEEEEEAVKSSEKKSNGVMFTVG